MDGGSERRREERGRESGRGRTRGQKLLFEQKKTMQLHWNVQCDCIGMFNATALECSMRLHWNVQCNHIGVHGERQQCRCIAPMHCIDLFLIL